MFNISNHGIKCFSDLLQLEPCDGMFKVISDRMTHWYVLYLYVFVLCNPINFFNAKKMICVLMFMIGNHYDIKCLSNLLQSEPCNVMRIISNIME